ncbi:MAG: hypothetical protein Kow0042_13910 [Calditrichia bacterium]
MNIPPHKIPILSYHKIDDRREFGLNTVKIRHFYQQMNFLRESGYQTLTFRDLSGNALPPKPVIITFDDGYASVYHQARHILQKMGFTAVIFIISGYIGKLNNWDVNIGGIRFAHLNAVQLEALSDLGMEIGSHGVSHRALTRLSAEEQFAELVSSKMQLEEIIQRPVLSIAYPFGLQNPTLLQNARKAGYHFGCINLWGANQRNNPLCLRRIPIYRTDSLRSFQRKLATGFFHHLEIGKLRLISWGARLTPLYQSLFRRNSHPSVLRENHSFLPHHHIRDSK